MKFQTYKHYKLVTVEIKEIEKLEKDIVFTQVVDYTGVASITTLLFSFKLSHLISICRRIPSLSYNKRGSESSEKFKREIIEKLISTLTHYNIYNTLKGVSEEKLMSSKIDKFNNQVKFLLLYGVVKIPKRNKKKKKVDKKICKHCGILKRYHIINCR